MVDYGSTGLGSSPNRGTMIKIVSGETVFNLVDRYGLPLDVIVLEFRDRGLGFNVPEFIDSAFKAGWKEKRIKWMLKSSCEHKKAWELINKYLELCQKNIKKQTKKDTTRL